MSTVEKGMEKTEDNVTENRKDKGKEKEQEKAILPKLDKQARDAKKEKRVLFEEVMLRTLHEMTIDLAKVSPSSAGELQELTKSYTGQDIIRELRIETSKLCAAVVQACHDIGKVGDRYLGVFTMIQPSLRKNTSQALIPAATSSGSNSTVHKKKNNKKKKQKQKHTKEENSATPNPSETIERLLSGTEDKDLLLSLADSIFKDLDLGDQPAEQMSMPDMFSLMTKACGVVQEKVSAGDLDMEKLQEQAMSFCQQIQHNPDLQNIIASNPVLAGLQLDVQSAQGSDEATATVDSGGIGNLLMGMMSTYQTGNLNI